MQKKAEKTISIVFILMLSFFKVAAQLSPGDLANPHAQLEGLSNCTQCHILGNKVSNDKCLACHTEIKDRMSENKGYHASAEVKGKQCIACHSDHNGKNFQLVRLDITKFDHNLTGYSLSVPHAKKECKDCHNAKYISDQKIKAKTYTYLGVGTECLICHADYHQKTLSSNCLNCHSPDAFKPASKFNHSDTKFPLVGKHVNVSCIKCHLVDMTSGKKFQKFQGIVFENCTSCHKDPHQNKFGQNCSQCHSEESFKAVKVSKNFDHNKTDFKLVDKHLSVSCQACHKTKFTDPLKHDRCTDCHIDYHKKQFVKKGIAPDCSQCHNVKGFKLFSYTIQQHKTGTFPLLGAHEATPCTDCHKKQKEWNFKGIGINCKECHKDIHQTIIPAKYYPEANCKICHTENSWSAITFDHSITDFKLTGAHTKQECRACHFRKDTEGNIKQKFSGLAKNCTECHIDNHFKQFEKNGITTCTDCHDTENWKASKFNHNNTAFKLDGKHINVACVKCHKPQQEGSNFYVRYKIKEFKCESCHL
jgi:nitrate/TMAO reductase-like tetraheme cytochrome c subunit